MPRRHALPTLIAAVLLACAAGAPAAQAVGAFPSESDLLDSPRHGQDAISHLGDAGVQDAAARGGLAPTLVRSRLRQDPTNWLDRKGHFFVSDTGLIAPPQDTVASRSAAAATSPGGYDYSQTFKLHSRPGSNRVIYLDFDGQTISGTSWNTSYTGGAPFVAEPFDTDGSPSTFSSSEQDIIQNVWQRVAEDYATFDVDVTTQDPGDAAIDRSGPGDLAYGTRALITNTSTVYSSCGCGGIAYVGTFDNSSNHASYQPAFVFQRGVGAVAKYIAEAASHEVGHNLGLSHDGTATAAYYAGQGVWAPIMGVGYYLPLTQWSRGEYPGANNQEDDFAVIQSHGASLLADDYGNSQSTAAALTGPSVSLAGRITTRTDTDWFAFSTTGGQVSVSLAPAPVSPDLDAKLVLHDSTGAVITSADLPSTYVGPDQADNLGAAITVNVPAGTYALEVDGVGAGDPALGGYSDYASVGAYTLTGTLPAAATTNKPPLARASVSPLTGTAPLIVTASSKASSDPDGSIASRSWQWGDGTTSTADGNHTYASAGTYTITLLVTDNQGATGTTSLSVTVVASTVPAAASNVTASVRSRTVTVRWIDNASNESGYIVQRESQGRNGGWGNATTVASTRANTTQITDNPGRGTYRYTVKSFNGSGSSAGISSNPVSL